MPPSALLLLLLPLLSSQQSTTPETPSTSTEVFHCRLFHHGWYNTSLFGPETNYTTSAEQPWGVGCPNTTTCVTGHLQIDGYPDWYFGLCGSVYGCTEEGELEPRNISNQEIQGWLDATVPGTPIRLPADREGAVLVKGSCCTGIRCNAPLDGIDCSATDCTYPSTPSQ